MYYNLTDPNLTFENLPFDQVNYTSSVCIIQNYQAIAAAQSDRIEIFFILMTFFLAADFLVGTLNYLKSRRKDE